MSVDNNNKIIRVGSRKSELALIQTKYVISRLQKLFPLKQFEIHTMTTVGDRVLNKSLPKIGEKSLFTKDLEIALETGGVDFVVHSLKDLPTALPAGMAIGAVLKREDPRDALVLNEKFRGKTLTTLPTGSVIGTSSLRRSAQLSREYPHLTVCDIRGNLNTRLAKLDAPNSQFSGIILAQAGLVRMGWEKRIDQILEPSELLYAVGQGALAVECRSNDENTLEMLSHLAHPDTQFIILTERSFLKTLGGGCSAPVAVCTNLKRKLLNHSINYELDVTGAVWSLDGKTKIEEHITKSIEIKEDHADENEIPSKRLKLDTDDRNRNDSGDNETVNDKKSKSPELRSISTIDDNNTSPISELDLETLISVHGEAFKKCPFSAQHKKDTLNKLNSDNNNSNESKCKSSDGCPLHIPIGQDFMGKCPYFNTDQKIELHDHFTHASTSNCNEKSVLNIEKCPFKSVNDSLEHVPTALMEKCPFLSTVKLFEYDESTPSQTPTIIDDSDNLFCGLFQHKSIKRQLYEKFQESGIQLANCLIKRGALDVMGLAQKEIRGELK